MTISKRTPFGCFHIEDYGSDFVLTFRSLSDTVDKNKRMYCLMEREEGTYDEILNFKDEIWEEAKNKITKELKWEITEDCLPEDNDFVAWTPFWCYSIRSLDEGKIIRVECMDHPWRDDIWYDLGEYSSIEEAKEVADKHWADRLKMLKG